MIPFFDTPERCQTLNDETRRWIGTPFLERCGPRARQGACADCTWVAIPLQRLGAIGAVPWPKRYVSRGGGPEMLAILVHVLKRVERLACVWRRGEPEIDLLAGDVLLCSTGKQLHHLALVLDQATMVHSWDGAITLGSIAAHRDRLLYAVYRPVRP